MDMRGADPPSLQKTHHSPLASAMNPKQSSDHTLRSLDIIVEVPGLFYLFLLFPLWKPIVTYSIVSLSLFYLHDNPVRW